MLVVAAQSDPPIRASDPPIRVNVNGTPVAFTGAAPIEVRDAVLVPLRGVFQALGATVGYDPATKIIHATKGAAIVTLPLGAMTATVNGQPQTLSQPAQALGGTTLVPLRFVAQALGAYVQWDAAASTVQIKTVDPHLAALPTAPGGGAVVGQATGVFTDTNPQTITVRVNGVNTSVPLGPQTAVLRDSPGQTATPLSLAKIRPGDQVTILRGAGGVAVRVTASFGEVRGTIKSIGARLAGGGHVLTLNDGTTVEVIPSVPVTMAGRRVTLGDVMANEDVVVHTDPANKTGYGIAVVTPDDPDPTPPGHPAAPDAPPPVPATAPVLHP